MLYECMQLYSVFIEQVLGEAGVSGPSAFVWMVSLAAPLTMPSGGLWRLEPGPTLEWSGAMCIL